MSSETPADPDRTSSSDASTEARPRRAREADDSTPGSPSTPVRFPSRADGHGDDGAAADEDAPTRTWTWQIPSDQDAETADQVGTADQAEGRRVRGEQSPADSQDAGSVTAAGEDSATTAAPEAAKSEADQPKAAPNKAAPKKAPQTKPAAGKPKQGKAPAKTGKGQAAKKGAAAKGQTAKGQAAKGQAAKGKGGPRKAGAALPTRRKKFRLLQGMGPMERRPEIPDQSHLPAEQRTDLAIKVSDLSITYRTSFEKKPTLRQALTRFGRGQRAVREVEALKSVTFEVRTGTAMGIIGANGAGKSTLMRAMAGILPPTTGSVEVWGRASTLLALGVGFNNSLSGRENIILGGLAAGLSREQVEARADEIADWTELGDFIDMPMRTYSSGMFSRVAFSVAVHMEPDILMIDEALSTGDAHFKEKASAKMAELRSRARAMFLVSHGLGSIKDLCDEAIWIDKGRLMERGEPNEVVDQYLKHMKARRSSATMEDF
ncbi:ABC-type polysaccharide/polyol phosphate transport system, ATPase component [Microlunatus soli]|uniref:ABC-type polysaccharide/polyol phosphate transport system, ATPase component n=1 Tax=Microlunatus soli TaxID=630515 RepID=A0A1H1UND0_9ACTN|nr:ABC-type polysaccharide/polyol phosphate transport system, ATPase component [Microlunatus soli]